MPEQIITTIIAHDEFQSRELIKLLLAVFFAFFVFEIQGNFLAQESGNNIVTKTIKLI